MKTAEELIQSIAREIPELSQEKIALQRDDWQKECKSWVEEYWSDAEMREESNIELYWKYAERLDAPEYRLEAFLKALAEHDKEIILLIDEMINDRYMKLQSIDLREPNELNDAIAEVWQYQIDELAELKQKITGE